MKHARPVELTHAVPLDGRGRRSYEFDLRLIERDRYLREAARLHCDGMSVHQAADYLRSKLLRYREGGWRRDQSENLCPPRLAGRIEALLWCVLRCRDAVPGDRLLRDVLARD